MKKIIKYGTIPTQRATCLHCGTEFEFDDRDVDVVPYAPGDYGYVIGYTHYTTCPLCEKRIEIKKELKADGTIQN